MEYVVWSVMLGGLLTLGTMAVVDVFVSRTLEAWRALIFMGVTGTSCVLLSGLPEDLFPNLPVVPVLTLKTTLGPLSGAMVLIYLKQWLGVAAEDRFVHQTITWGTVGLLAGTVVISLMCVLFATTAQTEIMLMAAAINAIAVLLATATSLRAAQLGDRLARTMTLGCLALAVSLGGLFAHQLVSELSTLPLWVTTAFSTVVFFLVMVSLGIRRNRQLRKLERLSQISQGMDPATGLPRGASLLSKVDDAFWRSNRLGAHCVVICLHLRNLYDLSDVAGHSADQQILTAMAARARRALGFRCVLGLYHPRCFVVVLSAVRQPKVVQKMTVRLQQLMSEPMDVFGNNDTMYRFVPQVCVGMVTVSNENASPAALIDEAEQRALANDRSYNESGPTVHGTL